MGQIITWGSDRDEDEFGGREVAAAGRKKENAEAVTMRRRWRVKFVAVFTCQDHELSQRSQRAEHAGNPNTCARQATPLRSLLLGALYVSF